MSTDKKWSVRICDREAAARRAEKATPIVAMYALLGMPVFQKDANSNNVEAPDEDTARALAEDLNAAGVRAGAVLS